MRTINMDDPFGHVIQSFGGEPVKKLLVAIALGVAGTASAGVVTIGDVTDNGDGSFFIRSGGDLGTGALPADVESALNLQPFTLEDYDDILNGDGGDVLNASAWSRSITVGSNSDIIFDWLWETNEAFASGFDFAFLSISDTNGLRLGTLIADTFDASGTSGTFSLNLATFGLGAGTYQLGIGVADVDVFAPAAFDSFLTIGPIVKTPAPGALALLALGLIGFGAARRR